MNVYYRITNAVKILWLAYKNPLVFQANNLTMMVELFRLIFEVATKQSPRMTHLAYLNPDGEEQRLYLYGRGVERAQIQWIGY